MQPQDYLVDTLQKLRSDPSRVVVLYQQLAEAQFWVLVKAGTEHNVAAMHFLSYPADNKVHELPLFTHREFVLSLNAPQATLALVPGHLLWPRLLDIIKTGQCEAAVNPGQTHGIRLTREMILGMVGGHIVKS
ncbi:SseB family protein [Dyella sp. 2HG41-7]|uniref:SseB family protein n=1 Tax=Dyella sp. 2HG41-7 TaxID=2883239 RepID=UPI001F30D936|nr:SseB family protein [Dyella sp. 2HG41-7]